METIKDILKTFIPEGIRRSLSHYKSDQIIRSWNNQGRPVPPPDRYKQRTVTAYAKEYNCHTMVETGTYYGAMIYAQIHNFKRIYSIELNKEFWATQHDRFKKYPAITILHGDSGRVLHEIVPKLDGRSLFWLDAHYSGGLTAKGAKDCPIYEELDAIFASESNHILLIDDARCFDGTSDYPTIEDLSSFVISKRPKSKIEVKDDIIRIILA